MLQSIYYVAGWHITACFKTGKKKKGKLGKIMISLFKCGTVDRDQTGDLPTGKVLRSEMFRALHFVSDLYVKFILRLEYIFARCLTPMKLVVLGNSLLQQVYY